MSNVLGLVSFRIFPTHMGGQKGVALFYKYLQQHLNVLLAVSNDNQESKEIKTVGILHPNKKIYRNTFKIGALKKIIAEYNIDVIIAEHSYTAWMAWLLHKTTGKPFIIHSHNIECKRFQKMKKWWWRLYKRYEKWIHRKAQHNFFISEEDKDFAVKHFKLAPEKCSVITYGIEEQPMPVNKSFLKKQLGLGENKIILLFNGTLDYEPNYHAVETLIDVIEPMLRQKMGPYEVVITGNRIPKELAQKILHSKNISYTGYVDDVNLYYQAADVFVNPVSNDTGVKTKLIEAIGNNCTAVSTQSGAAGIKKEFCADKLIIANDDDWNSFADEIVTYSHQATAPTPSSFYDYYSWKNIAKKASAKITEVINT